ncbi:MAG: hypothetical protein J6N18_03385 [Kiritimatiellae bacterium]|nr:hypothetical protein [Kiritimatiellia bacterium]
MDYTRTGPRASDGRHTDWKRTGGALRITRPTIDARRTAHGLAYGLLTDGRRAGIGQTWTNPAIPRWAATARRTCDGHATDF